MKDVIDLDGTCLESVHKNDGKPIDESILGDLYRKSRPYQEIISMIKFYDNIATRNIITGRKLKFKKDTQGWIEEYLGFYPGDYEIEFIGFVDYESYVKEKINKILEIILHGDDRFYRIFEDDDNIINGLEKALLSACISRVVTVYLILVRGGKAWKRKLVLR